jgi:UDP-2,4-diacetamido-2,4,6-trideoxy-beta-L-altropyranose hydrolase
MVRALFRCDASPAVGGGHVSRCLALAEELAEAGWDVNFAVGPETLSCMPALAGCSFAIAELSTAAAAAPAAEVDALTRRFPDLDLLVVDHYGHDFAFEGACRRFARRVLVFDDGTGRRHDCDLLVDAAATTPDIYAGLVPQGASVLAGPAYALVRHAFRERRSTALQRRDGRPVKEILLSFGATDPGNVTERVLAALDGKTDGIVKTIALSSQAPHVGVLRRWLNRDTRLVLDGDMAALMTNADLALGAAGASAFERAALGLPSILVNIAENQDGVCYLFATAGAAVSSGGLDDALPQRLASLADRLLSDAEQRMHMARAAAAVVDGRGVRRVVFPIIGTAIARNGATVRLRLARLEDKTWLFDLQHSPGTRRYFRNPDPPDPETHSAWLRQMLDDPDRLLTIIEADGERTGMIRLDRSQHPDSALSYTISIAVEPCRRDQGIGMAALDLARRLRPASALDAEISPDNTASKKLFTRAGFCQVSGDLYRSLPS